MAGYPEYYSTEGGGDYKAFLEHFKRQAEATAKPVLLNSRTSGIGFRRGKIGRGNMVLVETQKDMGTTKNGTQMSKIESVDPNEAERRRAVDEVVREEADISKVTETLKNAHSTSGKRKRKIDNKGSSINIRSKIQRTKDVFDD